MPSVQSRPFVPAGGLDLVTPVLLLKDGVAFDASNYECDIDGGVSRISGYDRYVNGPTAAENDYRIATVTCAAGAIFSDQVLRGQTSGATMRFVAKYNEDEYSWVRNGDSNIAVYVTEVFGQFVVGEILLENDNLISASIVLDSVPTLLSTGTPEEVEVARARAEAAVRKLMNLPGKVSTTATASAATLATGPTLGVVVLNDIVYVAKKQNPDLTGAVNVVFLKPQIYTGQGSTTNRDWAVANNAVDIPAAGAKFEFALSSMNAPALPPVIYGVSGTSKAFQFDGTTLTYITTGMTVDKPSHMAVHANRLFLAFKGSLQYSPLNTPFGPWVLKTGADELSMGSDITGLLSVTGENNATALLIATKENLHILYGKSDLSFQVVPFSANTGALPLTLQWIGQPVFQSAFGLTALSATQRFGGFSESTLSGAIKPFIDARRGTAVGSMVCRDKNQYRVFFGDGTGVYTTFSQGKVAGHFTQKFKHRVTCAWSCVLSNDKELMLIGTQDGELYKLDVGTSFAGATLPHHIRFAFNQMGSPRNEKHFKRAIVEVQAQRYVDISLGYDLDYGDASRDVSEDSSVQSAEGGVHWDEGDWDSGYWDAAGSTPITVDTPGNGSNISIRIRGDDNVTAAFTLSAVIIDYINRRHRR